jgi:hypothetical protein
MSPAGVGPATKRIQALFQFGYNFVFFKEQLIIQVVVGDMQPLHRTECS